MGYEYQKEQGWVSGRSWKEEKEWQNFMELY